MSKILFIGAPGHISTHSVNEVCRLGHEAAAIKRSSVSDEDLKYDIQMFYGDRDDRRFLENVVEEYQPDIVADFVCYKYYQAQLISDVLKGKVKQYVFVSSIDYYNMPLNKLPWKEEYGVAAMPYITEYAVSKYECEKLLMRKYVEENFPVTIVRPGYCINKKALLPFFHGRNWLTEGNRSVVERLRAGKPLIIPGDGNTIFQPGSAKLHGEMIAWLLGREFAIGEDYNCVPREHSTLDEYVRLVARLAGAKAHIVHIPTDILLSLGLKEIEESFLKVLTQYNYYYSCEKFEKAFPDFPWISTPEQAIKEHIEWNDRMGLFGPAEEDTIEDRIIEAWIKCSENIKRTVWGLD